LASAAFFGVGVYTTALLGMSLPLILVISFGGIFSLCLALVVGILTLRLKGIYFVMFTFGLVELFRHFIMWWEVKITGTTGRVILPVDNTTIFYILLTIFTILLIITRFIRKSKIGLALQSIGECEEAAAHSGVNVTTLKISLFALSAFFMGTVGAIMATRWTYIDPQIAFNPQISFLPVLMAIFGGVNYLFGPIIGAAIFTCLEEILITRVPYYYMLIFGFIMLISILFLPKGLIGFVQDLHRQIVEAKNANT
jgi:branched-chain amino acid transport system permease protein